MERDFEKEFRELKQSEVPNLWNRIEAGLTPKQTSSFEQADVKSSIEQNVLQDVTDPEKNSGRMARIYKWSLLAAACLCLLIVLPVFFLTDSKSSSSGMTASKAPAAESAEAADESFDMAKGEAESGAALNGGSEIQSAESTAESYTDSLAGADAYESAAEDNGADMREDDVTQDGMMKDSVLNSVTNSAEASRSEASGAADSISDDSEEKSETKKESQADKAAVWDSVLKEGQLLSEVQIQISTIEKTGSSGQSYTIHSIVVVSDEADILSKDTELILACSEDTIYDFVKNPREEMPLQTGEKYIVDLRYDGNGTFGVIKAAKYSD